METQYFYKPIASSALFSVISYLSGNKGKPQYRFIEQFVSSVAGKKISEQTRYLDQPMFSLVKEEDLISAAGIGAWNFYKKREAIKPVIASVVSSVAGSYFVEQVSK